MWGGCAHHQMRVDDQGGHREGQSFEILSKTVGVRACRREAGETVDGACDYARFQAVVSAPQSAHLADGAICGKAPFEHFPYELKLSYDVRKWTGEKGWSSLASARIVPRMKTSTLEGSAHKTGVDAEPVSFDRKLAQAADQADKLRRQGSTFSDLSVCMEGIEDGLVNLDLVLLRQDLTWGDRYQIRMALKGDEARAEGQELQVSRNLWWLGLAIGVLGIAGYVGYGALVHHDQ